MKKLILILVIVFILFKMGSCTVSLFTDTIDRKKEIEDRIDKEDEEFIKRLQEGL